MNRRKEWQKILEIANNDLALYGYSLLIVEPEEGFYNCEIWKDGKKVDTYAENYYEDELDELVNDAWFHIKSHNC